MHTNSAQNNGSMAQVAHKPPKLPKSAPKVRLSVISGPGAGQTIELSRCVSVIGSRHGCKLVLKSPDISAVHAAIINNGEQVFLRDLVTPTGTKLNNLKAQFEQLDDGDTISVGDWSMRIHIADYNIDTLSDLPHVSLEPEPAAFGVEVNGTGEFVKLSRPVGLVGRKAGCDIVVDDRHVSRAHMVLFTYLGQPVFYDLLSNNGVVLEGERQYFAVLHSGDYLQLGPKRLRLILPGVARRKSQPPRMESGTASVDLVAGSSAGTARDVQYEDSSEGTVVQLAEEEGDRIDIRAAELEGR